MHSVVTRHYTNSDYFYSLCHPEQKGGVSWSLEGSIIVLTGRYFVSLKMTKRAKRSHLAHS